MQLTVDQQTELSRRYEEAREYLNQTISFDIAQTIRAKYYDEIRAVAALGSAAVATPASVNKKIVSGDSNGA